MITWLKSIFSTKFVIQKAIDTLDLAVPYIAIEIEKAEAPFKDMTPAQKAQFLVDKVQDFLRKKFEIPA